MTEPSSETEVAPGAPPAKKGMGKIIAVIVVILLILVAVAAWRLLSVTPPTPPVNRAPTIQSVAAERGAAEVTPSVAFTVNATDLDGDTLTYEWKFGDGTNATTATATHTYALAGNFIAVVTVSDGEASVTSEANPIFMLVS